MNIVHFNLAYDHPTITGNTKNQQGIITRVVSISQHKSHFLSSSEVVTRRVYKLNVVMNVQSKGLAKLGLID